jgi:hypothetical protein
MRAFGVLLLSFVASACFRENKLVDRFVEDYCEARWACGCDSPGLTQVHCESQLTHAGEEAQDVAQDAGLEYDRECAKAWIDAIDDSCSVEPMPNPWAGSECGAPCLPYHGRKAKGEPCEALGPWSDCGRGLVCGSIPAVCMDPCDGQREGDVCDHGDFVTACAPGLVCNPGGVCGRPPALGEACASQCAPGGMCDLDTRICVEAPGFGEPCGQGDACGRNLRCTPHPESVCDVGSAKVCGLDAPW